MWELVDIYSLDFPLMFALVPLIILYLVYFATLNMLISRNTPLEVAVLCHPRPTEVHFKRRHLNSHSEQARCMQTSSRSRMFDV